MRLTRRVVHATPRGLTGPPVGAIVTERAAFAATARRMTELEEQPREFPRYEIDAYVDYTGSEVMLYHRIQNISLGGICIQSSGVEDVGTTVDLVINFPDLGSSISLKGEVVWVNRSPPMDMGIRYVDLDGERKETLRRFIGLMRKS